MGFERGHIEQIRPYVTVYGRKPRINAASADLVVLAAVPGIEHDVAQAFVAHRTQMLADGGTLDYTALRNGLSRETLPAPASDGEPEMDGL